MKRHILPGDVVACSCGMNLFQVTQLFLFLLLFITCSCLHSVYLFNTLVHIWVMCISVVRGQYKGPGHYFRLEYICVTGCSLLPAHLSTCQTWRVLGLMVATCLSRGAGRPLLAMQAPDTWIKVQCRACLYAVCRLVQHCSSQELFSLPAVAWAFLHTLPVPDNIVGVCCVAPTSASWNDRRQQLHQQQVYEGSDADDAA